MGLIHTEERIEIVLSTRSGDLKTGELNRLIAQVNTSVADRLTVQFNANRPIDRISDEFLAGLLLMAFDHVGASELHVVNLPLDSAMRLSKFAAERPSWVDNVLLGTVAHCGIAAQNLPIVEYIRFIAGVRI